MKLYYSKGACSLAVRIVINELGLTADYEAVNLKTKQTEINEDFLKINPKGAVPTLVTDEGQILTENSIIQQYLADQTHNTQLLPGLDDFNRYRTLEWLNYVSTELHKGFGPLFNPEISEDLKNAIFIPLLHKKFSYVNKHLERNQYLMGNHFSLPDGYLFVILRWALHFKFILAEWPHLSRYFTELQKRPSIQKSLQQENLSIPA